MGRDMREEFAAVWRYAAGVVAQMGLDLSDPVRDVVIVDGIQITVTAQRVSARADLTPCESDMLVVLAGEHPRRLTGVDLVNAMARAKKIHGQGTVNLHAPRLVRLGLAVNDHDRKGYGITEAGLAWVKRASEVATASLARPPDSIGGAA